MHPIRSTPYIAGHSPRSLQAVVNLMRRGRERLARLLDRRLTAESTPDRGTSFTLWLPRSIREPAPRDGA